MEERPPGDPLLVESVLRGDRDAIGDLVARYQSLVAGVAWRYGIRREEIEDVVSEVFLKAYRNLHRYRPDHPFSTWLYRLAANHVVDHTRRTRREPGRAEMPQEVADPGQGPEEDLAGRERAARVREALRELDPRYRKVIFLVYVEGLRVEEAARLLGLPEGTVKTRLMRGRQSLRRILLRRNPGHFGGG